MAKVSVLCMCGLLMVRSMSNCALHVTVQQVIRKLEARHVLQVAQG